MAHVAVARTKRSGARTALVFRQVSLLVCFVSHGFASVSHPKFLFRFEAKQAKLGGQFRYFASKSFASFRFSFASKRNSGTPYLGVKLEFCHNVTSNVTGDNGLIFKNVLLSLSFFPMFV